MDYWKEQSIENFIIELGKYYEDPTASYFQNQGIVDKLNKEELDFLNKKIDLSKIVGCKKEFVLNKSLKDKEKNNFSHFILRTKEINIEVNSIDDTGKTVFILLAENYFYSKDWFSMWLFNDLFARGYKIKDVDKVYVNQLYKKISKQNEMEKWSLLRFAVILDDAESFELAMQNDRVLFTILSYKLKKPINFKFPNLLGVSINAIQHYRESGDIILQAMEHYNVKSKIENLDIKKGTFARKKKDYFDNKPIQNKDIEKVICKIFPELKAFEKQ